MTITGCDWPNFFSFCCSIYKFLWNSKIGSFYTYSCESPKLRRFVHDMTVANTTTKPDRSDWQKYDHKAQHIRLMAVPLKAWHIRLTAVLLQSLVRETDSSTATKPGTSDWQQYCHKAWHVSLTLHATKPGTSDWQQYCMPQSPACQTDISTTTKPDTSD